MKRDLTLLIGGVIGLACTAQNARLVFNNASATLGDHPFIVFNPDNNLITNPGAYLVIDNSNANAITLVGTVTANVPIIKSETELNKIRWAMGSATGTYVVPFSTGTTAAGVAMPLTIQKTSTGVGAGSIVFSTFNSLGKPTGGPVSSGWDNENYLPLDVTHINDEATGSTNNSKNAVDRFWIIDAGEGSYAYTTKPAVNITFAFDPVETQTNGGNDAGLNNNANNLVAQRFNSSPSSFFWYDILPMGSQTSLVEVSGVIPPTVGDFYRSWTLSNTLAPLPIQLVAWYGQCEGSLVKLTWTTATEQDNAYFTIEKSKDASTWATVGQLPGAGNSSNQIQYVFTDPETSGLAYYRLRQTDIDGNSTVSPTIAAGCDAEDGTRIVNAWDDGNALNVVVSSSMDGIFDLTLLDAQGKLLLERPSQAISAGSTTLRLPTRSIASGIYVARLQNASNSISRRVHLN